MDWHEQRHALGLAALDTPHREFAARLAALERADEADFPALFQELLDHTRLHFAEEGRLMRLRGYPALGEHEGEHHRLLGELLQFDRSVKRGRLTLARAYIRCGLSEWFELHLATMDSALAAHLKERAGETAGAPERIEA